MIIINVYPYNLKMYKVNFLMDSFVKGKSGPVFFFSRKIAKRRHQFQNLEKNFHFRRKSCQIFAPKIWWGGGVVCGEVAATVLSYRRSLCYFFGRKVVKRPHGLLKTKYSVANSLFLKNNWPKRDKTTQNCFFGCCHI
jgi:hypothetical protein